MQKEPLLPLLPRGEGLRSVIGRGTLIGRGVVKIVVVGLGHDSGCKGRSDGSGVFREEE